MNHCEDCKHWNTFKPGDYELRFRRCHQAEDFSTGAGGHPDVFYRNVLAAEDGDQYAADVLTGPKFGCVLFKSKEVQTVRFKTEKIGDNT